MQSHQTSAADDRLHANGRISSVTRHFSLIDYLFAHENLMMALMILYGILIFPIIALIIALVHGGSGIR